MPEVTEPITTLEPGGFVIDDPALVQGVATAATVSALDARVGAVEESGGSEPDLSRGPFTTGAMLALTKITEFSPTQLGIPAGNAATVGIRAQGRTAAAAGVTRSLQFTVQNLAGVLSTIAFDAGADITAGSLSEAESGWSTAVRIRADGATVEVLGLSPEATSNWLAFAWLASLGPLSTAGLTDTAPEVTMTTPAPALALAVPTRWMSTVGITGWYASQVDTLPAEPVWLSAAPATVTVSGSGAQTIYYWGRTASGVVTARKQLTTTVVLDATPPIITAFELPASSSVLSVDVTTLTATETVTWFYNFTGTLPGSPTWAAAPSTISFPDFGTYTVYMWCRDTAGNVCTLPAEETVVVADTYFQDLFTTLDADWVGINSPIADVVGGALRRTDTGTYRILANYVDGLLPAEYFVTWRQPHTSSASGFNGFILQLAAGAVSCVQVFWENTDRVSLPRVGWGTPAWELANGTWIQDLAIPATWASEVVHQVSIGVVNSGGTATYTLYLDGVGVAHVVGPLAVAGRGIGVSGEGTGRLWLDVQVTPTLPAYDPTP